MREPEAWRRIDVPVVADEEHLHDSTFPGFAELVPRVVVVVG